MRRRRENVLGENYCKSVGLLIGEPSGEWRRERAAGFSTIGEAGGVASRTRSRQDRIISGK